MADEIDDISKNIVEDKWQRAKKIISPYGKKPARTNREVAVAAMATSNVDANSENATVFNNEIPDEVSSAPYVPKEKLGFWERQPKVALAMVRKYSMTYNAVALVARSRTSSILSVQPQDMFWYNPEDVEDTVRNYNRNTYQQDTYHPEPQDLVDVQPQYLDKLINNKDAEDFAEKKQRILREQEDNAILDETPWWNQLPIGVGTFVAEVAMTRGAVLAVLPTVAKAALYSTPAKSALMNIITSYPKMTAGAAIYNLPAYLNRLTTSAEEYALGSFIEGIFGSVFHGGSAAIKSWKATRIKAAMVADNLDLEFAPVIDKFGKTLKYKVKPKGEGIKGTVVPEDIAMSPADYVKKEMNIADMSKLTDSEKFRYDTFVQEVEQSRNLPTSEIVKMRAAQIERLFNNGIEDLGVLDTDPLGFLLKQSPVLKIMYSPYAAVREGLGGLYSHQIIAGHMTSKELHAVTTNLNAAKLTLAQTTDRIKQKELKQQIKLLRDERNDILKNGDKKMVTYDGQPSSEYSVQSVVEQWNGRNKYAEANARKEWQDFIGTGELEKNAPFFEKWQATKNLLTKAKEDPLFVWENFKEEISIAIQDGKHANPHVWRAAEPYIEILDGLLGELQSIGKLQNIDKEKRGYLHRMINLKAAKAMFGEFVSTIEKALMARDKKINQLLAPEKKIRKELANLKRKITIDKKNGVDPAAIDVSKKQLAKQEQELIAEQAKMQELRDKGNVPLSPEEKAAGLTQESLLDNKVIVTKKMQDEYDALMKPARDVEKQIQDAKIAGDKDLEKTLSTKKRQINKELKQRAEDDLINKELTYKDQKGKIRLRNLEKENLSSFAKKIPKGQYVTHATNTVNSYTGMNEEQLAEQLFGGWLGIGNPNALKERTMLFGDSILRPYMQKDITKIMESHVDHLAKHIAMEKYFRRFGSTVADGQDYLVAELTKEHAAQRDLLFRKPLSPARTKLTKKLDKQFEQAKDLIQDSMQMINGKFAKGQDKNTRRIRAGFGMLKAWAFSNMMGAVALFAAGDMVAPMIRHGMRHLKSAAPMLKQMFDLNAPRYLYADLNIGLHALENSLRDALWGNDFLPGTLASRATKNLTKLSSNIFLIDPLFDASEVMATKTIEASMARNINEWFSEGHYESIIDEKGKSTLNWVSKKLFTPKEIEYFHLTRFNFAKYGKAIQQSIKEHGEEWYGSIIPNTQKWENVAAAEHYRMFVKTQVNHLLNRVGPGDVPYWAKQPALSAFMQFTSWGFGATNNYLIPTMQRPDRIKFQWAALSTMAGMTVGPLRDLLERKEIDWDWKKLLWNGVENAGLVPWYVREFSKANTVLQLPFVPKFIQNNRYKGKSLTEVAFGPTGSLLDTSADLIRKGVNGELTAKDWTRGWKLLPWVKVVYGRPFWNSPEEQRRRKKKEHIQEKLKETKKKKKKKKR
jgi:hypothetical protein